MASTTQSTTMSNSAGCSRLFQPYRALGLVADGVSSVLHSRGSQNFLTVSNGRSWQVFKCQRLTLALISPPLPHRVAALAAKDDLTFVASPDGSVSVWRRTACERVLRPPSAPASAMHPATISQMLVLGNFLVTGDNAAMLRVWSIRTGKQIAAMQVHVRPDSSDSDVDESNTAIVALMHPPTYVDKVLVALEGGILQLWNIRKQTMVYQFQRGAWCTGDRRKRTSDNAERGSDSSDDSSTDDDDEDGDDLNGDDSDTAAEAIEIEGLFGTPVVDVVALTLADGRVVLHNLRYDEHLLAVRHSADVGAPTAASFRTDGDAANVGLMATGSISGSIVVWELGSRRLATKIHAAHAGPITALHFLPGEPLLLSLGADNAVRIWIFDAPDGKARLLRQRQGHTRPPRLVRYYGRETLATARDGSDGTSLQMLSAGSGADATLRTFHAVRDQQNAVMSQRVTGAPRGKSGGRGRVGKGDSGRSFRLGQVAASRTDTERYAHTPAGVSPSEMLPPIVAVAAAETKERHWASVVTAHAADATCYTWRFDRRARAPHCLRQFDPAAAAPDGSAEARRRIGTVAHSVAISTCGNFALVGCANGVVYKYNLQSGLQRGAFPAAAAQMYRSMSKHSNIFQGDMRKLKRLKTAHAQDGGAGLDGALGSGGESDDEESGVSALIAAGAHAAPVSGVAVDALNTILVSAGMDGQLRWWGLHQHRLQHTAQLESPASALVIHRDAGLAAVACDDLTVRLFDIAHKRLVRHFGGHAHRINDLCFSPDARWLLTAGMDQRVRVWDVPSSRCIDWMHFDSPVLSLDMSPSGEFLTTAHAGSRGLFQWANRTHYRDDVLGKHPPDAPAMMDEPMPVRTREERGDGSDNDDGYDDAQMDDDQQHSAEENGEESTTEASTKSVSQETAPIAPGVATLSCLPRAMWRSLFHLELIRARNKPIEPPKAPEAAPFFLPTTFKDGSTAPDFAEASAQAQGTGNGAPGAGTGQEGGDGGKGDEDAPWDAAWDDDDADLNTGSDAGEGVGEFGEDYTTSRGTSDVHAMNNSRIGSSGGVLGRGPLASLLRRAAEAGQANKLGKAKRAANVAAAHEAIAALLKGSGAARVDVELRSLWLGEFDRDGEELIAQMTFFLARQLRTRCDFEVMQAYLNRFLVIYGDLLKTRPHLRRDLEGLLNDQQASWAGLHELMQHSMCLLQFMGGVR